MPPNFSVRLLPTSSRLPPDFLPTFSRLAPISLDFCWDDFLFKSGVFPPVACVSQGIPCFLKVPVFPSILLFLRRDRALIAIGNDSR